jgi:hypothetical protein
MYHDPASMWMLGGPVISDGILYIGSSNQFILHSFDPVTGALRWKRGVDCRIFGNPLPDGDFVFFGTGREMNESLGSLYAVNRLTGALVNRIPLGGQVHSSPVIADGTIYVGSANGSVYALDRRGFLENPLPATGFEDRGKVNWGALPAGMKNFEAGIAVYNEGNGSDSVSVAFIRPVALAAEGVLSIEPARFALAPGDSQVLTLRMDPSRIKPNKYTFSVQVASKYNLEQRTAVRSVGFTVEPASGLEAGGAESPESFSLGPNYPNPFNPRTILYYCLPAASRVRLEILDALGRRIRTLVDGSFAAGRHAVEWNGSDDRGNPSGTGTYFCRLTATTGGGTRTKIQKILLVK